MLACQIRDGVMQLMLLAQAQAPQLTPRSARSRSRCSPWTLCLFLHLLQSLCIFGMLIASNVLKYKESLSHSVEDFRIHIDHVSCTDMRVLHKFIRIFANGVKDEIESPLLSYNADADASVPMLDSPEGREGRKCSTRLLRGAAYIVHFNESKQKASTSVREM